MDNLVSFRPLRLPRISIYGVCDTFKLQLHRLYITHYIYRDIGSEYWFYKKVFYLQYIVSSPTLTIIIVVAL